MLALAQPRYGIHYMPGDPFFTWEPGSFLTHNIALESDRERYEKELAVPTHCGLVSGSDELIEATRPKVQRAPLAPLLENGRKFVVVKRLAGQTQASAEAMIRLAGEIADKGAEYDTAALFGFPLSNPESRGEDPNFLEDPDKYFCSELLARLLKETAHLRTVPPPEALIMRHASWWTPNDLYSLRGLWEAC
jgi:hypothetical protein